MHIASSGRSHLGLAAGTLEVARARPSWGTTIRRRCDAICEAARMASEHVANALHRAGHLRVGDVDSS
jgi:hypothetical protein